MNVIIRLPISRLCLYKCKCDVEKFHWKSIFEVVRWTRRALWAVGAQAGAPFAYNTMSGVGTLVLKCHLCDLTGCCFFFLFVKEYMVMELSWFLLLILIGYWGINVASVLWLLKRLKDTPYSNTKELPPGNYRDS